LNTVDVALIARGDDVAKSYSGRGTTKRDAVAETTALRYERNRTRLQLRFSGNAAECGVYARMNVCEPQAIRAYDPHASLLGDREHLLLPRYTLGAALTKPAAQNHHKRHFLSRRFVEN